MDSWNSINCVHNFCRASHWKQKRAQDKVTAAENKAAQSIAEIDSLAKTGTFRGKV
ncbi:MAG: hypothetical protein R2788_21155 [Saprospiraceae bacterium]